MGALSGLLLVSVLVVTIPLGLAMFQVDAERQSALAQALAEMLCTVLSEEQPDPAGRLARINEVFGALESGSLPAEQIYVVDARYRVVAAIADGPTGAAELRDPALEAALEQGQEGVRRVGPRWLPSAVEVTRPIDAAGEPLALRVRVPVRGRAAGGLTAALALVWPTLVVLPLAFFYAQVWLRRSLVRPIQALRDGTRRIAQGGFGHQLGLDAARELEELRDDLNALSLSLLRYRRRTRRQLARLKRANTELAATQAALVRSERLATVGRLAAGLAHEVGNPLAAVLGFQELLAEGLDDPGLREPELERDLIARSRKELERIHRIIRQLLDYARPGSGQVEDVEVAGVLRDAVATVGAVPAARGVSLEVEVAAGLPAVRVERDKLYQVTLNLLLNAVDALGERRGGEGPAGRVRLVAALDPEGVVEIRCEDNGPGFSDEALSRAFEPFFSSKSVGKGTGLGLATCQQVVEGAGGQIAVMNGAEGGAVVRLRLPAAAEARP